MYAVKNIRKFVDERPAFDEAQADAIVAEAKKHCYQGENPEGIDLDEDGVVSGELIDKLFEPDMARAFHDTIMSDPEHMMIGLKAMRKLMLKL